MPSYDVLVDLIWAGHFDSRGWPSGDALLRIETIRGLASSRLSVDEAQVLRLELHLRQRLVTDPQLPKPEPQRSSTGRKVDLSLNGHKKGASNGRKDPDHMHQQE